MATDELVIDRLHVHRPGRLSPGAGSGSGPSLRLGLEQALRQVRPRPAHLPPQAILVIRSLASRSAFGLSAGEIQRWRRQLEAQIDELAREAARPGRQFASPQANSVLFDDEVDLLLCYTRDLLAGRWAWYWEELFTLVAYPGQPTGQRLLAAWQTYPQAIPHTLAGLPPAEAAAALGRLNDAELSRLAHSLHETFALPRGALDAAGPEPGNPLALDDRPPAPAPWQQWLPAGTWPRLPPPVAYLLGLSHALARRPGDARTIDFGRQARHWLEAAVSDHAWGTASGSPKPEPRLPPPAAGPANPDASLGDQATTTRPPTAGAPGPEAEAGEMESLESPFLTIDGTVTHLGGAIYLINLMTRLGLPEAIPDLAGLSAWELLGGLVVGLLGRRAEEFAVDPLWAALNELAGLEPEQPWGASLPAPGAFELPAAWLALLPSQKYADAGQLFTPDHWPEPAGRFVSANLAWWVQRLRPFLAALLAYWLDQDDPDVAAGLLLCQPATLYISRTHVDLVQSLEQISLPLRRAGLDQSPGWRPAFGYIIAIHFE